MSTCLSKSINDVCDSSCVVCCRNVIIYAIGECDHPVCFECTTRMRVLCRQNECPICRRLLPKVIFMKDKCPYSSISNVHYPHHDRRYKIFFVDVEVEATYLQLLEHRCKLCKTSATFANFNLLKDHIRRDHEKYFCDLCVEHLTIFSHERKSYTRSELARHRRIGDSDDSSHRGHPLCEFCDERFLENDELFRHLRREHFFCHFCDADGFHHYYNDYEYLREHFRLEHFLCEEDNCQQEKFTTAFRSEIDLKAHKATAHNKTLSKVQAKQARTLELEFSIKPRLMMPSAVYNGIDGAVGGFANTNADDDHNHKFRRGGSNVGGMHPSRSSDRCASSEHTLPLSGTTGLDEASTMEIDINSENFPKLGEVNTSDKKTPFKMSNKSGNHVVDTLARKLAKLNRFTVGNSLGDNEFPALSPKGEVLAPVVKPFTTESSRLWSSTTSEIASFSATSSNFPLAIPATQEKIKLKLNSQADFPGLTKKACKPQGPPSISLQMQHKQKVTSRESDVSTLRGVKPFVTRLTSTQNITCQNSPQVISNIMNSGIGLDDTCKDGIPKSSDRWYTLKKKSAKKESDRDFSISANQRFKSFKADLSASNHFPALEIKKTSLDHMLKEATNPVTHNCWKVSDDSKSQELELLSETQIKGKKKKQKVNASSEHLITPVGHSPTKDEGKILTEPSKKKKKQLTFLSSELPKMNSFKMYTENQENEVPAKADNFHILNTNCSDLEVNMLSPSKEPVDLIRSVTDDGFHSMLASGDEFPGLPSTGFKKNVSAPPGFHHSQETASVGPPPGFLAWKKVTNPPPGFGMSPAVTFTNSNGQNYMFATSTVTQEYIVPDGFQVRNKKLMEKLIGILANDKDNISNFRRFSGLFRKGEMPASDYYKKCSAMMKKDKFACIFPELVNLLPDIGKQQMLLTIHNKIQKKGNTSNIQSVPQFLVCATCQQVLSAKDFESHVGHHNLDEEFPPLNNSNTPPLMLQATCVKNN